MDLGSAIRARRAEQNLTLEMLAQRSGVSRAMLSEIERGAKNPTVKIALQIAAGLGCTLSDLLGEPPPSPRAPRPVEVVRRGEQRALVEMQSGIERHDLAPSLQRRGLEILWYVLPANRSTGPLPVQPFETEAHLTVIWGRVLCRVGDTEESLGPGDSISFPADQPHQIDNSEADYAHVFWVLDRRTSG